MRSRHRPKRMHGGSCEQRARGGGVTHHPHSEPVKVIAGEGERAKLHAARRSRGGTCWYCGRNHADGGVVSDKPTTDKAAASQPAGPNDQQTSQTGMRSGGGIHIKPSHKGLLHKNLGVAAGHKIPAKALTKAKHSSDPAVRKRAVFAANAKKWHH